MQATNSDSAAFLSFHRPGFFGCHMGLSADNQLKIGGWSYGTASYNIWHQAYGTPVWQTPSDATLKENIRPIPSALQLILECKPVSFRYNKIIRNQKDFFGDTFQRDKIHYGFLADEVPLQDLVSRRENGFLGLDYLEFIPFLCRAIQEMHVQITELKTQLKDA
ncbi:tail fiber domain-containing protein [Microcoleus vaginatus]|uniref:tail fiber domain-containing protein n=1 Tax=Microcoleus vaginatus TaxID=119532 RepID=UPI00403F5DA7